MLEFCPYWMENYKMDGTMTHIEVDNDANKNRKTDY